MQTVGLLYCQYPVHQKWEMLERKQLRDYDLMDSIFFFFYFPQLYIDLNKKKLKLIHMGFKIFSKY